ncbi:hypothetical protein SAMD00019534_048630 [Acytostelium subglobosum LB1]|uniref:hypothetical protein n=1 Tax=Acytostelium subglobosum LB1 TaxID=1410327 RepID=UPI000644C1CE|nr:hypothetical protein SAMD00019534_048630 [Acytostelium subglobosum LB1]GAM21688.1 hypothetical protein SAMD00019534_048630 [Acytostelium subglobosum LB1]|eukprot:XP_012755807.1 hypothetical protein SAMD00019534_048630 [Acytostelium subglobosum LB1]
MAAAVQYPAQTAVPFAYVHPGACHADAKADAEHLRKAMKGMGTDEKVLISILGNRNWEERAAIIKAYSVHVGRDLIKDIKSETSGNFEKICVALLTDPAVYDAENLFGAMKGIGTNENTITEILVTRCNAQKHLISNIFNSEHHKTLKHWIQSEVSGDYKNFCEHLLEGRDESMIVDAAMATKDADALYHAGEGKIGTDEKTFIHIMTRRNFLQIREIARVYPTMHKHHSLEKAIESEFSGDVKNGLLAILHFANDSFGYFAEVLHKSMEGAGTNDNKLIRNVLYCMPFIQHVKQIYLTKYGKTLHYAISNDCSGDYKKLLLEIVKP